MSNVALLGPSSLREAISGQGSTKPPYAGVSYTTEYGTPSLSYPHDITSHVLFRGASGDFGTYSKESDTGFSIDNRGSIDTVVLKDERGVVGSEYSNEIL